MKIKKAIFCFAALLVTMVLSFGCFLAPAGAFSDQSGSIRLNIVDVNTLSSVENVSFRLYYFAAAYENGSSVEYEYVVPYGECQMDIDNLQDPYFPVNLTCFAQKYSLPYSEKASDENGVILFENLAPGAYLLTPSSVAKDYFMPSPFVINIPCFNSENKVWEFDVDATPKMQISSSFAGSFTHLSVKKKWADCKEHPEKIYISLLRDLKGFETVELSDANGWSYKWKNLSAEHTWNIVEADVPDGFAVSYDFSSDIVTVINSYVGNNDATTLPEATTVPDDGNKETTTEPASKPDELIDTGQLNWPVPVLSLCGILIFSLGWAMLNFSKKEKE